MRLIQRFAGLPRHEQSLLVRAWLVLWGVRVLLWISPYQWVADQLPTTGAERDRPQESDELIAVAVVRASRFVPVATCLVQAVACGWMIRREGGAAVIRFGVAKDDLGFRAHAWLESHGRILVGGGSAAEYVPLVHAPGRTD